MGKTRHLARHGAQAKARLGRIIGGFQAAIVEPETLRRAILQIKLAIIGARQRLGRQLLRQIGVERIGAVEKAAGVGELGHRPDIGSAQPKAKRHMLARSEVIHR